MSDLKEIFDEILPTGWDLPTDPGERKAELERRWQAAVAVADDLRARLDAFLATDGVEPKG